MSTAKQQNLSFFPQAGTALSVRLERSLSQFLEAVEMGGEAAFHSELALLLEELRERQRSGTMSRELEETGYAVGEALKAMASSLLDVARRGEAIGVELGQAVNIDLHEVHGTSKDGGQPQFRSLARLPPGASSDDDDPASAPTGPALTASGTPHPSTFRHLRDWFLEHLEHPFPTAQEKASLARVRSITVAQVNGWLTNMRRRSGWTQTERDIAGSDHNRMRKLVLDYRLGPGKSTLSREVSLALEKIEDYVDERGQDRVRDWMINVIEETSAAVRDGRDKLGDDSEPEDDDDSDASDQDDDDDDRSYDGRPAGAKKRKAPSTTTLPPRSTSTAAPARPKRAAAQKATAAVVQGSPTTIRSLKPLPKLRVSQTSSNVSRSVSVPSSPPPPEPSMTTSPPVAVRQRRTSDARLATQPPPGRGLPSSSFRRTSTSSVRKTSGTSSLESTAPGTPEEYDGGFHPNDAFHPYPHEQASYYGPPPPQEYATYGQPPQGYYHVPPHSQRYHGHPRPSSHAYPHPYESHGASYLPPPHQDFPLQMAEPSSSRPAHPRQYSWAGEPSSSATDLPKRPSKRRALSQQLPPPPPPPSHQLYYPGQYAYHPQPMHYGSPPPSNVYHSLPPMATAGPEPDRVAALQARKVRIKEEEEMIRREEVELGLGTA